MRKKIMIFLLSSMLLAGCGEKNKDVNVEKDCGCDATVTEFTIPEDEPLKGTISFVEQDTLEEISFKYVLLIHSPSPSRGRVFYICNDELIPSNLRDKLSSGTSIEKYFYFSGNATKICDTTRFTISGVTHNHLFLTKFEEK